MTDLSVIIVSYNVRAFLEQCLVSVERAMNDVDGGRVGGGQPKRRWIGGHGP